MLGKSSAKEHSSATGYFRQIYDNITREGRLLAPAIPLCPNALFYGSGMTQRYEPSFSKPRGRLRI